MVEALRYKPEGRGVNYRCCHWNFSLTKFFRPLYGPGVDSASNRNECQEYFLGVKGGRCVGLATLPPSCAIVLKSRSLILLEPSGPVQACNGIALPFFYQPDTIIRINIESQTQLVNVLFYLQSVAYK